MDNANKTKEYPKFGMKDKISYAIGDMANDFSFIFTSSFLMVFYTKVLGVNPAVVGTLFLISRVIDAFADITIGRIVDTAKPAKDGRFRSWIRRMAPIIALSTFSMFIYGVQDASMPVKVAYIYVTYIIWGILYSSINIPYGSMASVISPNPDERASLSVFRSSGAAIASIIISFLVPKIVFTSAVVNGVAAQVIVPVRFTIVAAAFAVTSFILYRICYSFSVERVQTAPKVSAEGTTIGKEMKAIARLFFSDRSLLTLIGIAILLLLSTLLVGTMNAYVYPEYFNSTTGLAIAGIFGTLGTLILAPFAGKIAAKFGKKESGGISLIFAGILYAGLYFTHVQSLTTFLTIIFLANLGQGYFMIIIWAFITDVIDNMEIKNGVREDATVYACYSFARKIGQALAGGLGGYALTVIGYQQTAQVQTEAVKNGLYQVYTVAPAVGLTLAGIILLTIYPLGKKKVLENNAILLARRDGK
jgi:glycoside/pentoside/hexuronide:cation symporter, GPH family